MAQSLSECEGGCVEDLEARGGEGELTHGKRSDAISGPPHGAPALISGSASAGSSVAGVAEEEMPKILSLRVWNYP